jgi:hypothetical protein
MSIATGISAVKTGFELIKSARELLTRTTIDPAEVQNRLLELQALMLEAQEALRSAEEENRSLKRRMEALTAQKHVAETLEYAEHLYWQRAEDGRLDGPYCTTCWDHDRKLIRLKFENEGEYSGMTGRFRHYKCVLHNTSHFLTVQIFGPPTTRQIGQDVVLQPH